MSSPAKKLVLETFPLGRQPWKTIDPFLFCVYHNDQYPAANGQTMGPDPSQLRGRSLGSDFSYKDGWSMYHGQKIPGFPQHPHRGFETITVTQRGTIDHFDSMGACGRYGGGDTQWMTAGGGVQHAEMFPLTRADAPNPLELFQIWLNLPAKSKMVTPHFAMIWDEETPRLAVKDRNGAETKIKVICGLEALAPATSSPSMPPPPPNSWAAAAANDVAVWIIDVPPKGEFALPPAKTGANAHRVVYCYDGNGAIRSADANDEAAGATPLRKMTAARVDAAQAAAITNSMDGAVLRLLVLQGRPIGEPVAQHGPFVMNSMQEIQQTMVDYQRTQFGGWPWPGSDHTHPLSQGRMAKFPDGEVKTPPVASPAAKPSSDEA